MLNQYLIEGLVDEYKHLLVSQSIYNEEDLRQEISLCLIHCENNHDNSLGTLDRYVRNTVRNKLFSILKRIKNCEELQDSSYETKENIYELIPEELLSQTELMILHAYLAGSTFNAIAFGLSVSREEAYMMFKEIILKIQEANED